MKLNTRRSLLRLLMVAMLAVANALLMVDLAMAQNGRPTPERPTSQAAPAAAPNQNQSPPQAPQAEQQVGVVLPNGGPIRPRQPLPGRVSLAFNDVPVDEKIVAFIADSTGKVVIPINMGVLRAKRITLMTEEPIERSAALDLLLTALRLSGVGISESDDVIILDDIQALRTKPVPVYTARDDIMGIQARGNFIVKIFRLREAPAEGVGDRLMEVLPDFATLSIDPNSNQIILYADVGTAQHFQRIIQELDRSHVVIRTHTFRLAHADASAVAQQITELFENSGAVQQQPGQPRQQRPAVRPGGARQPQQAGTVQIPAGQTPGPVVELRVSVNVQQNAVTVSAEPEKIEAIQRLVAEEWDIPRAKETFRVYVLEHTDPIKMRDLIQNLLGGGGAGRTGAPRGAARVGQPAPGPAGGAAGAGLAEVIGDIYRVEAYPDRNSIVVLSKTTEALDYLDAFIAANDLPSTVGLPQVYELKHANAVSLADELNVLLAETGAAITLERPGTGLTAEGIGGFGAAGGGTAGATGGGGAGRIGGAGAAGGGAAAGTIQFPWQTGRQRDDQSEPSSLIGKVRIVPIVRQNALAVLAPVAQRYAIMEMIRQFDKPGRQVMISAIIAEVQLTDDLSLGLRLSSFPISPTQADNALGGTVSVQGTRDNVLGNLFTSSVLDVNADVNVILQALRQKTNVRIIQQPRIFTADNQEAAFFDGQEIPFITATQQTVGQTGLLQSFDYKDVGVLLNVRPRITVQRDVDMEIRLMLSAVVPGQVILGGAVLDRRETTTKVIVKNGQTIVLSGLLKDVDSRVSRGIPFLSDIPLLGELFKSRENTKATSELIAFITPIVVDNPSENDENFNVLEREYLKELSKPLNDQAKRHREHREQVREKILAPRTEMGFPIPFEEGDEEATLEHPPHVEPQRPVRRPDDQPEVN